MLVKSVANPSTILVLDKIDSYLYLKVCFNLNLSDIITQKIKALWNGV